VDNELNFGSVAVEIKQDERIDPHVNPYQSEYNKERAPQSEIKSEVVEEQPAFRHTRTLRERMSYNPGYEG
jgi:hypothetical protein